MKTKIQIEKKTAKKLKSLKLTGHETYDEIINRIMEKEKGDGSVHK